MKRSGSLRRNYLMSTIGAALAACLLVGLFLFSASMSTLREASRQQTLEKLNLLADSLSVQRRAVMGAALDMAADVTYRKDYLSQNLYRDVELLNDLPVYASHFPLSDDFFLLYPDQNKIYLSTGHTNHWDYFARARAIQDAPALHETLLGIRAFDALRMNMGEDACAVFAMPMYTMGRGVERGKAVFVLIISPDKFLEYAETFTGQMPGTFAVYYENKALLYARGAQEAFDGMDLAGAAFQRAADGQAWYLGGQVDGAFRIAYLAASGDEAGLNALRAINAAYITLAALLSILTAAAIGYANFRPVMRMRNRLQQQVTMPENDSSTGNELEEIAGFVEHALADRDKLHADLQNQYAMVRRQFLRLLCGGDAQACALAKSGFMGVELCGPYYLAILMIPKRTLLAGEEERLSALIGGLSDGDVRYYLTPTMDARRLVVLVNLTELDDDAEGDAVDSVASLLPDAMLWQVSASPPFSAPEDIPNMLRVAAEDARRKDEERASFEKASNEGVPQAGMLGKTVSTGSRRVSSSGANPSQASASRAEPIIAFIQAHFCDPDLSLDMLSEAFDLSNRYISSLIREQTGVPYKDYLTDIRIEKARELLTQEGLPVSEACSRVGYTHLPSFIKTFRRHTGSTPARYVRDAEQRQGM